MRGAVIGLVSSVGSNLIMGSDFGSWTTWLDIGISTGLGALFGFWGGAGATNANSLDKAVHSSTEFMKAATSYSNVLSKIANGAYSSLAGAAGARALTRATLQAVWQNVVKMTIWKSFGKSLAISTFQTIIDSII